MAKAADQFFSFFEIKRQATPIIKKVITRISNSSASANINPLPYCPLSKKALIAKKAKITEIVMDRIPLVFSKNENIFIVNAILKNLVITFTILYCV